MTVDELRARKRELLARKKYESELQEKGEGDNLALFMVNEELMDVNDHLRALVPNRPKKGEHRTNSSYAIDRQQYLEWEQKDDEGDAKDSRVGLYEVAKSSLEDMTARQREILGAYLEGVNISTISHRLGVNRSTVSRTLSRAKKAAKKSVERKIVANNLDGKSIDLNDQDLAKAVFLSMTWKQSMYFYLYYSEYMSLREIERLLGIDHAAISRTLLRALRNIQDLVGSNAVVENPQAIDELAYQAYCQLENHPELLPDEMPKLKPYSGKERSSGDRNHGISLTRESVYIEVERSNCNREPGKLLTALLEKKHEQNNLFDWFHAIFLAIMKFMKKERYL